LITNSLPGNVNGNLSGSGYKSMQMTFIWMAGAVPLLFLLSALFLGWMQSPYDIIQDTISAMVWGHYGWIQTVMFYLLGVVLISLACWLFIREKKSRSYRAGLVLLGTIGLTFVVIAICPTRQLGTEMTLPADIHEKAARFLPILLSGANFLMGNGLKSRRGMKGVWICSIMAGVSSLIFTALGAAIITTDSPYLGILELVLLLNGLVWLEIIVAKVILQPWLARQTVRTAGLAWRLFPHHQHNGKYMVAWRLYNGHPAK
jgi:hypothetical protein